MDLNLKFDFPTNSQKCDEILSKREEEELIMMGLLNKQIVIIDGEKEPEKKSQEANHNVCIFPNDFPVLVK